MKTKKGLFLIVILLILSIGLGYAALSANLKINGSSGVKSGKWIIYFDRIQNESGVVSTDTKITNNKTQVDFNITLTQPGDYYEFDVDTVNDGTIDAMIESTEFGEVDSTIKDVVTFDVTYKDGTKIKKCDILAKNSRKTITVKVHYKQDITEEELITNQKELNLNFKINYVQNTTCENKPTLIVDPNGGTYNGSSELTEIKVNSNSDTILDAPTKDNSEFLYFKTESGTPLEKDENGKTTVHVDDEDVKVIANWKSTPKYVLTIDPNGGFYNAYETPTILNLIEGETLTLENPIRDGYIFDSWEEVTETNSLNENIVTMPALPVTVKAVWKTEADYVARINTKYYTTIQKAFDAAVDGDTVHLLKSTTENGNNTKNISFNLGGFTVTGTITNSGTLTIDNGRIENVISSPFVNTGTVNVGTHDGNMVADSIVIFGGENVNGLTQNGTFNFYDGYIEGKLAVTGGYNELEEGYYYIVDHDDDNNCQKAYLSPDIDAIVKIVVDGNDIYFKLLQDAIDMTTNDNPNIYAIKNFKDSHTTTIGQNQTVLLDISGFNIEEGAAIINNGTLTLKNGNTTKGAMSVREPMVNNGMLTITDLTLSQVDTGKNLLENSGDLNITNSIISSVTNYALNIKNSGDLVFDDTTEIRSGEYGIHNVSTEAVTITGGNIVGILNEGSKLTISNVNISRSGNSNYQLYSNNGEIYLNNINAPYEYYYGIIIGGNTTIANITGGTYVSPLMINGSMNSIVKNANITYIELSAANGELINNIIRNSGVAVESDGNLIITSGTIESTNSTAINSKYGYATITVNGGTITGKTNGITSGTIIINDGTITSDTSSAIWSNRPLNINGGTITSLSSNGVEAFNATITGGTINGKNYGVYISNNQNVTIGNKQQTLDITKPIIKGELYGVYIENGGNCNFYDGILKGKTRGFSGSFKDMRAKHMVFEGTEEIDDEIYKTAYPKVQDNFIEVNNVEYNSLQDAIDAAGNEGTMKLINNAMIIESASIPSTANITFDLNGKTLLNNDTVENNGTLTILDNTETKLGKLESQSTNYNKPLIANKGDLIIKSGNFESYLRTIEVDTRTANLTIQEGNFISNENYILYMPSYNNLNISGGTFETKNPASVNYWYGEDSTSTTISGGTFTNNSPYSYPYHTIAFTVPYNATITGGEFTSDTGIGLLISTIGRIENATVRSKNDIAILYNAGRTEEHMVINDIDAESEDGPAIQTSGYYGGSLIVNGGSFVSKNSAALYTEQADGIAILGGAFKGKTYGLDGGTGITIGSLDDNTPLLKPVFIGETSGANITSDIYYYDGIFKGKDSGYKGEFTEIPEDYVVTDGTEVIEGETYNISYLTLQAPFLQVGSNTYSSLKKAVAAINDTGTITVIGNGNITYSTEIPAEKTITLDLNGHTIRTVNSITNNGILHLKDSSGDNSGKIYNSSNKDTLINKGNLKIESGTYEFAKDYYEGININQNSATANLIIDGGIFKRNGTYTIYKSAGTATINNGEFYSDNSMLLGGDLTTINGGNIYTTIASNNELIINGGTIETPNIAIYARNSASNITINDGYIHSTNSSAIWFENALTITGGTIESDTATGIYTEGGTLTLGIKDGVIQSPHKPVIIGKEYGVYLANSQPLYFYDGIMKGELDSFSGVINEFETDTVITYDEETDDDVTLQTAFLVPQTVILHNEEQNKDYKDMNLAFQEVQDNETLTVVDDAIIYDNVTIPNKKVTLDLNNHEVNFIKNVTNAGELTIKDSISNNGYLISNRNDNTITNNNIIRLENIEMKNKINITNNSETYFDNVNTSDLNTSLITNTENSKLEIKDSDLTGNSIYSGSNLINNNSGTISITNTKINSKGIIDNRNGVVTIDGGTFTSTNSIIYSYGNSIQPTKVTVKNNAKLICTTGNCASITNNGSSELEVKNTTLTNGGIDNSNGGVATLNTITQTNSDSSREWVLSNSGTIDITDYTINSTLATNIMINSAVATINNLNAIVNYDYSTGINGIENSGTCNYNSGSIKLSSPNANITGIRNTDGTFNLKSGSIEVLNGIEVYGVYITNGTFTIGENETPTNLSTTDPVVTGVGSTSGIGIKKTSGQVNYYDGVITGSTEAMPEAPTDIPNRHRIVLQSVANPDNYDVRILEYVP